MANVRIGNVFEGPGMTSVIADGVEMVARFPEDRPNAVILHAPGKAPGEGAGWPTLTFEATHDESTREQLVGALAEGALTVLHILSPQDFLARGGE